MKKLRLKNLSNYFRKKLIDHTHASELRKIIDRTIYNDYFKFCVEREPVDKCISYYYMRKNSPNSNLKRKNMTWDEFVNKKKFPVDIKFYSYENNLIVDKIIKYENLDKDLSSLLSNLGIKNFKFTKKVNNNYRKKNPFVTNEQKKIIYRQFEPSLKFVKYNINQI